MDGVFHAIRTRATAEHLGQMLSAATALFMTTAATALLDFDQGILSIQPANDGTNGVGFFSH